MLELNEARKPCPDGGGIAPPCSEGNPGAVSAKALAKFHQPAGRASGPFQNFRPHNAPKISPTSAAPGKPLALRLPACPQATARVSSGRQKSATRTLSMQAIWRKTAMQMSSMPSSLRPP